MRVWIYGNNLKQVQQIKDNMVRSCDTVVGTSVCVENGSAFPQSGLTPALYSAMRGEIDQLIISEPCLLGGDTQYTQAVELFQSYGVSIKSASNCGINSS